VFIEGMAYEAVGFIIIHRLGPEHNGYLFELKPIDQGPEYQLLKVQKHNHAIGVDLFNLLFITAKVIFQCGKIKS
jgi:hypothetical protein